jgi:hypothetical protein
MCADYNRVGGGYTDITVKVAGNDGFGFIEHELVVMKQAPHDVNSVLR